MGLGSEEPLHARGQRPWEHLGLCSSASEHPDSAMPHCCEDRSWAGSVQPSPRKHQARSAFLLSSARGFLSLRLKQAGLEAWHVFLPWARESRGVVPVRGLLFQLGLGGRKSARLSVLLVTECKFLPSGPHALPAHLHPGKVRRESPEEGKRTPHPHPTPGLMNGCVSGYGCFLMGAGHMACVVGRLLGSHSQISMCVCDRLRGVLFLSPRKSRSALDCTPGQRPWTEPYTSPFVWLLGHTH